MDFRQELGLDPEQLVADADRFFDQMAQSPEDVATARAVSRDGWVSVEYNCAAGVRDLRLDPRAMRMDSAQLAETILGLIHQSRELAEAKERKRQEEFLGTGNGLLLDRQFIADRLRRATGTLHENLEQASATIDRVRALLRH